MNAADQAPSLQGTRKLPEPDRTLAPAFMEALAARRTTREIAMTPLPAPLLANLLWAAGGINRPATSFSPPRRTVASAGNAQEIEVYALMADGAYLYDAREHCLRLASPRDLRGFGLTAGQRHSEAFAPVQLLLVADLDRFSHGKTPHEHGPTDAETQRDYALIDGGLVAGNVCLFAAANHLAVWLHNCDRQGAAEALALKAHQRPLFALSVGFPAPKT